MNDKTYAERENFNRVKVIVSPVGRQGPIGPPGPSGPPGGTASNIENLHGMTGDDGQAVDVLGYYREGDGGGGQFIWQDNNTQNPVSGVIIAPDAQEPGRWVRPIDSFANVKWFGVLADGSYNDQPNFQAAVDYMYSLGGGTIYAPSGTYLFRGDNGVKWRSGVSLIGDGVDRTVFTVDGMFEDGGIFYNTDYARDGSDMDNPEAWMYNTNFSGFTLDGAGFTDTIATVTSKGIFMLYLADCFFKDILVRDTIGTGLGIDFLSNVDIRNVTALRCGRLYGQEGSSVGQSGIGIGCMSTAVESFTVQDCKAVDCGNFGIFAESQNALDTPLIALSKISFINCYASGCDKGFGNRISGDIIMTNCKSIDNRIGAIVEGRDASSNVAKLFLFGCEFKSNTDSAFHIISPYLITVNRCDIHDNPVVFTWGSPGSISRGDLYISNSRIHNNDLVTDGRRINLLEISNSSLSNNKVNLDLRQINVLGILNSSFIGADEGSDIVLGGVASSVTGYIHNSFLSSGVTNLNFFSDLKVTNTSGVMPVSGPSSERPNIGVYIGFRYFDTTLNTPIFWGGSEWVDASGESV